MTDWGQIACEMLSLLERSPEMRQMEDKAWTYLLTRIHPIHGRHTEEAYKNTRNLLCEYLSDHLGKQPNPNTKPTPPEYTDWLWVSCEVCQFIKDNPALKQVEPECWEWVLNQTYPLPPNHAPTARNMTKAVLENFMGDYGPTVMMIVELEGRLERERQEREAKQPTPGLLTPEAAEQLESEPRPTTTRKRGRQ